MTIQDLKTFFSQIDYTWTGEIYDAAWHVVPFGSGEPIYAPKTFEEILQYEQECQPIPDFIFSQVKGYKVDEPGDIATYCFRITPEKFVSYFHDISGDPEGSRSEIVKDTDYSALWQEFQKNLQAGPKA